MSALAFELPPAVEAHEPPEARGSGRDDVRLMVAHRAECRIEHARFRDLPDHLREGDLVVLNTSATLPAAVDARLADGTAVEVHFAMPAPEMSANWWVVELREAGGATPFRATLAGERVTLQGGGELEIVLPYAGGRRLWLALANRPVAQVLARHGHPIRYGYVTAERPLADYQTVYAQRPGSAEMPSAGRPFTPELITRLVARGIQVAPLVLHTGVSSPERDEAPYPERYEVPAATARLVNAVHGWGGRVIAIGTTVVRALETVADEDGTVRAGGGWTSLYITPERGVRAVDGLLSGWHEPAASHLEMLATVSGPKLLERSYAEALRRRYLWHEFGDSHLIVP